MTGGFDKAALQRVRRNRRTLGGLAVLIVAMGMLTYASVPLYQLFCQVTGYGGTTQVADSASGTMTERRITVRFDASVNPALDWTFLPAQRSLELNVGENALAFYQAENRSDETIVGTATFNVTPDKAGQYFNKVDCFCFTEQVLLPGQQADLPVSFFIDPMIEDDPNLQDVSTITLSYTFFRAEDQSAALAIGQADAGKVEGSGRELVQVLN